jgi:hypothetical protein
MAFRYAQTLKCGHSRNSNRGLIVCSAAHLRRATNTYVAYKDSLAHISLRREMRRFTGLHAAPAHSVMPDSRRSPSPRHKDLIFGTDTPQTGNFLISSYSLKSFSALPCAIRSLSAALTGSWSKKARPSDMDAKG